MIEQPPMGSFAVLTTKYSDNSTSALILRRIGNKAHADRNGDRYLDYWQKIQDPYVHSFSWEDDFQNWFNHPDKYSVTFYLEEK